MQHVLQISRKIDYGLRAMIHLAGVPAGKIVPLQDLATTLHIPREFLAKILKVLTAGGLVRSARGSHGGYQPARPPAAPSFPPGLRTGPGPVAANRFPRPQDPLRVPGARTMHHILQTA